MIGDRNPGGEPRRPFCARLPANVSEYIREEAARKGISQSDLIAEWADREKGHDPIQRWVIMCEIKSQNKTTYRHWTAHRDDRNEWEQLIAVHMRAVCGKKYKVSKWRITRMLGRGRRRFDHANLVGGCKGLVDCLVRRKIIVDDSPQHFECDYRQLKSDDGIARTVIELMSIGQEAE